MRKIRICHLVSGDLWAGAEVQVATLLASLIKRPELEVSVIVLNNGKLVHELRRYGIHVTVFDETKTGPWLIFKRLFHLFKENKVDILHTHRYKENILGGLAAKMAGVPCVISTVHGLSEPFTGLKRLKLKVYHHVNHVVMKYAVKKIIAVSYEIKSKLEEAYGSEKVTCVHNGVPIDSLSIEAKNSHLRELLKIDSDSPLIAIIGRLTPIKGHRQFLEAAKIILKQRKNAMFLIIGDGPLKDDLQCIAKNLDISQSVLFLGHRDDVPKLLHLIDILVISSLHEGIPTALLEALALKKAVVATRVGGIPEVITDRVQGLLVDSENPEAIATACILLLDQPQLAVDLGIGGRLRIEGNFSDSVMSGQISKLYMDLLTKDRGNENTVAVS